MRAKFGSLKILIKNIKHSNLRKLNWDIYFINRKEILTRYIVTLRIVERNERIVI